MRPVASEKDAGRWYAVLSRISLMGFLCGGWGVDGCEVGRSRQRRCRDDDGENLGVRNDGSHGQRLKTPRGPVPRRREEEEEGGRTWEKTCMADSLILPIAPTRGELVVVFTSVMAATCVGGMGAGWSATKTAKLAEKKAQFRRSVASTGSAAAVSYTHLTLPTICSV